MAACVSHHFHASLLYVSVQGVIVQIVCLCWFVSWHGLFLFSFWVSACEIFVDVTPDINFTGESNVYTLGNIGGHRIVSTKLPSVGHTREAMTAAGNTTTRLLGKFWPCCR